MWVYCARREIRSALCPQSSIKRLLFLHFHLILHRSVWIRHEHGRSFWSCRYDHDSEAQSSESAGYQTRRRAKQNSSGPQCKQSTQQQMCFYIEKNTGRWKDCAVSSLYYYLLVLLSFFAWFPCISLSLPPRSSRPTAALLLPPTIRQEGKESGSGPVYTNRNYFDFEKILNLFFLHTFKCFRSRSATSEEMWDISTTYWFSMETHHSRIWSADCIPICV